MRHSWWIWLLGGCLAAAGCSRDFARPPDQVELQAVWPQSGYTGDPLALCASHLDPEAEANEVTFGTVPAGVIGFEAPADWTLEDGQDWSCAQATLFVRVPVLPAEGQVPIQISNATGRASLTSAFDYLGPGHPVHQRIAKQLRSPAGLWSLFTTPGVPALAYGAVSREADLVSLFEPDLGLHLDFGQCAMPLSGAAALTDLFLDPLDPNNWQATFVLYWVGGEILDPEASLDHLFDLRLWSWEIDLKRLALERDLAPPEEVALPTLADGQPFRPAQVWAFQRPDQPLLHDLVASDIDKPALALFSATGQHPPQMVELPDQAPVCQTGAAERLGPIVDLVHDPEDHVFYAALAYGNEIWRIAEDGQSVGRAWPPPDPTGFADQIDCSWKNSALAIRRSHGAHQQMRLYVGDNARARVRVMKPAATDLGEALVPVALQTASFDGLPYALTTGQFPVATDSGAPLAGEHLYVATQNGLVVMDVTAYNPTLLPDVQAFTLLGEIPVPSNRGSPQSLITSDNFSLLGSADKVLLADADRDLVRFFTCGQEQLQSADVTIGASLPRLAASHRPDRLYLTDALSNTIQVLDPDSGLRLGQFPIANLADHSLMGFGSVGMSNLRGPDYDLLLLPLLDLDLEVRPGAFQENNSSRFKHLAFGRIGQDLPACGLTTTGMRVETGIDEVYHEMQLVRWDWQGRARVPVLVLTRRAEVANVVDQNGQPTGEQITYQPRTWCLELDPEAWPDAVLAKGAEPLCDLGPQEAQGDQVLLVRAGRRAPVIGRLEQDQAPGRPTELKLRLLILDGGPELASEGLVAPIGAELGSYITDLLVTTAGPAGEPIYLAYLPLSYMGRVLRIRFDPGAATISSSFITTGGTPVRLDLSPDGRQAYLTHPLEGRLDILRLDCEPVTDSACRPLAASLDVGPFPFQVEFDPSGRWAHAIHLFSNDITTIE